MRQGAGQRATRDSWQTLPLPEARVQLAVDRNYKAGEFAQIARGFVPETVDDRWFIYLDDDWLAIHRSWTGHCLYRVRFAREADRYRIVEAWANRDLAQFRRADDAEDVADILRLVEVLLLGRPYLVPE